MCIDKVKWILLAAVASQNVIHSQLYSLGWKGIFFFFLTLSHIMCPRKQATEPKLLILVSFFSGEVTSYTDTSHCNRILREICRSVFLWATLYKLKLIARIMTHSLKTPLSRNEITQYFTKFRYLFIMIIINTNNILCCLCACLSMTIFYLRLNDAFWRSIVAN